MGVRALPALYGSYAHVLIASLPTRLGLIGNTGEGEAERAKVSVGNATDALGYSDGQPFSALDRDNDVSTTDCARFYAAGWWYKHCHYANLNGRSVIGSV